MVADISQLIAQPDPDNCFKVKSEALEKTTIMSLSCFGVTLLL